MVASYRYLGNPAFSLQSSGVLIFHNFTILAPVPSWKPLLRDKLLWVQHSHISVRLQVDFNWQNLLSKILSKMGSQKKVLEAILQAKWSGNCFCLKSKGWALSFWIAWLYSHFLLNYQCFLTGTDSPAIGAERVLNFWLYSALQFSSSHLWRSSYLELSV